MTHEAGFRITQLGSNLWPECGGIYKSAHNFRNAFLAKGHTSEIVSFDQVNGTQDGSITHYPVSRWPGLNYMNFAPAVFRAELKERVEQSDCVLIHGGYSLSTLLLARHASKRGVPFVMVPHGGLDPWVFSYRSLRKNLWIYLFRKELFRAPSAVIYATEQEKRKAASRDDGGAAVVINWPVQPRPVYEKQEAESALRQRFHLPAGARVLLYCGRIHPMKRVLETVRAFLAAETSNWVLLVVGPFSHEIRREELETASEIQSGKCVIAGAQFGQHLQDCYRGASAFVSLSHRENFGYTVAEAASYGLPVLLTRGVDLFPDVVRRQAGAVCDDESEDGFRRAIEGFCNLPGEELRAMGECGRNWVAEELSPDGFASNLNALIDCVCDNRGSRSQIMPIDPSLCTLMPENSNAPAIAGSLPFPAQEPHIR